MIAVICGLIFLLTNGKNSYDEVINESEARNSNQT